MEHRLADAFVVVVAFFVAIVKLRHRRITPVDDLDAGGAIDDPASPDQHITARRVGWYCRSEPQVTKIGRLLIDGGDGFSASARGQGADARHLLDERCQVFGFGFCNRVAQFDKLGLVAVAFAIRWQRRSTEEVGDLFPEPLLFRNDGKSGRGRLDWPRHGVRSMPGKPIRGNGSRQKDCNCAKDDEGTAVCVVD